MTKIRIERDAENRTRFHQGGIHNPRRVLVGEIREQRLKQSAIFHVNLVGGVEDK
ncbi:MAG TPA: hypothetical protein VFC46_03560 [Humisphaera sp.]|nr:hypothetical protein [Humisphaera sp.]